MAHLNLVMIHPFRDGNGRMARALATLVLTRSDIGEPEFCSIEEWLGANTDDYYSVLAHTGHGSWKPRPDPHLWLTFNLRAHHMQAPTVARRVDEARQTWSELDALALRARPPRTHTGSAHVQRGPRLPGAARRLHETHRGGPSRQPPGTWPRLLRPACWSRAATAEAATTSPARHSTPSGTVGAPRGNRSATPTRGCARNSPNRSNGWCARASNNSISPLLTVSRLLRHLS